MFESRIKLLKIALINSCDSGDLGYLECVLKYFTTDHDKILFVIKP